MEQPHEEQQGGQANASSEAGCRLLYQLYNCTGMEMSDGERAVLIATIMSFIVVNLLGNSTVIVCVLYFRQLQTRTNALTLSLAVADVLIGAVIMPLSGAREAYYCWFFGRTGCRLHTWLDYSLTTSSIVHMGCVAADRYVSISDPMRYRERVTPPLVCLMVVLCWLSLAGYGVAVLAFWPAVMIEDTPENGSCPDNCDAVVRVEFAVANTACAYATPIALLAAAYAKIYQLARRQMRKIASQGGSGAAGPETGATGKEAARSGNWRITKREHNATRTLGTMGGVFVLCWLPYFFASAVESLLDHDTATMLVDVSNWFSYANSAVNPLLIVSLNRSFRAAFRVLVRGAVFERDLRGADLMNC